MHWRCRITTSYVINLEQDRINYHIIQVLAQQIKLIFLYSQNRNHMGLIGLYNLYSE